MSNTYDVIVLGAGAMGSAAAYHLARSGQRVLLLEQFEIDHQKGSSYGLSRIIRYAYDHPAYIALAKAVYPMWADLEQEAGEKLYTRTGGLDFGRADQTSLTGTITALKQAGIPYELPTLDDARKRFPQFRFDDDMLFLYQADAGILAASKCVRAHIRLAEKHGAVVLANTPVIKVVAYRNHVEVQTDSDTYVSARLVITAGSWAKSVLLQLGLNLPLVPVRCHESYFDTESTADYETDRFPVFIAHMKYAYDPMPYGIASHQGSGLKVAFHGGRPFNHPSEIDYKPDYAEVDKVLGFAQRYLVGVTKLRLARVCLYTVTPDDHFLIDKHPEYPHIVFGGGCSGHSFKFATLIGKVLSDLTLEGSTSYDVSLFNLSRFL